MSLRRAVAAPFVQHGERELRKNQFVVALSLDRDWFSPDQATRLIDVAVGVGELERDDDRLRLTVDPASVTIPEDFVPAEDVLREQSAFERILEGLVSEGVEKRDAVGAINRLQRDLAIDIEAAAVVYARGQGVDVAEIAPIARESVLDGE